MLKFTTALTALSLVAFSVTASAEGENTISIKQLPKEGYVTLSGSVESIDGNKEFTLRDNAGDTIDVESEANLNLHEGDRVKVSGSMNAGFLGFGKEIEAASIEVIDAADEVSGNYENNNNAYSNMQDGDKNSAGIDSLPDQGYVSLSGIVESVDYNDMTFTLKDSSGEAIKVSTNQRPAINKGDQVTVKGHMHEAGWGMSNEIKAENIQVSGR